MGGAIGAWAAGKAAAAAGALLLTEIVLRTAECSEYSRNAIDSCSTKLLFVQQNQVLFNKSLCFVQQNCFLFNKTDFVQQTQFCSTTCSTRFCSGSIFVQQSLVLFRLLFSKIHILFNKYRFCSTNIAFVQQNLVVCSTSPDFVEPRFFVQQ